MAVPEISAGDGTGTAVFLSVDTLSSAGIRTGSEDFNNRRTPESSVRNECPGEAPAEQGEPMTGHSSPQQAGQDTAAAHRAALFSDADAATDRPARTAPARPPLETLIWQAPGEGGQRR